MKTREEMETQMAEMDKVITERRDQLNALCGQRAALEWALSETEIVEESEEPEEEKTETP